MKNTLILGILLSSIFWMCRQPEGQKEFTGKEQFRTTEPSRIYFNNVRSSSYYSQRQAGTRIDTYRLRKLANATDRPLLTPLIVNNWMEDEAYIFIRKNEFEQGFSDTLTVKWLSQADSGYYYLPLANKENQYQFAGQLYESLQQKHRLYVKNEAQEFVPLFDDYNDKQQFRTVLKDYYRLTEVY